ncbi:MAG TPA: hypothetical protein VGQ64_09785 [Candidatus Limnocylindrales bacterium]|jgi:hypothetical protein|nr:hypothetical protein [Candidatus Limnocylindrales bacterium]
MDALVVAFVALLAIIVLLGLDLAAISWGADSRPGLADDHRR